MTCLICGSEIGSGGCPTPWKHTMSYVPAIPKVTLGGIDTGAIHRGPLLARASALDAEVKRLRQAYWDGRAILGCDNDGDPTPRAVASDFAALILGDCRQARADLDEARAETEAAEAEVARVTAERDAEEKLGRVNGARADRAEAERNAARSALAEAQRVASVDRNGALETLEKWARRAERAESALAAERQRSEGLIEENAVLRSQVENADATWAQQKACTDRERARAEKAEAALREIKSWTVIDHTVPDAKRIALIRDITLRTPSPQDAQTPPSAPTPEE